MGRVEKVKQIVKLVIIFDIFILAIYFWMNKLNLWQILSKTTLIIAISLGVVYLFNNYLWRFKCKLINFFLDSPPNIEGKWKGTIVNTKDGKKQNMKMSIKQTYLEIFITVEAERGRSTTYAGDIIKNNQNDWKLMWIWHANYKGKEFSGTTIVDIINEDKLKGFYFTNANIDGRGCTAGEFEAEKLK